MVCSVCKLEKASIEFTKSGRCKECNNAYFRGWRAAHPGQSKEYNKRWGLQNRERLQQYNKKWRDKHPRVGVVPREPTSLRDEERSREVQRLYTEEHLSYAEIGRRLQISRQRVHQLVTGYESFSRQFKDMPKGVRSALSQYFLPPTCAKCGKPAEHTHHLDGNHANNSPSNLQRLCVDCHGLAHIGKPHNYNR